MRLTAPSQRANERRRRAGIRRAAQQTVAAIRRLRGERRQ